jgi:predicted nuclease with TOPRIM domain
MTLFRSATEECLSCNLWQENDRLQAEVERLQEENEHFRITLNAENDRLERNIKLEEENARLRNGILKTLEKNCHLADGDDCTLKILKELIGWK